MTMKTRSTCLCRQKKAKGNKYYFGFGVYTLITNKIDDLVKKEMEQRDIIRNNFEIESKNQVSTKSSTGDAIINRGYYFESLETNLPNNVHNSCGYVALSIVMGYMDYYYDYNLLPSIYENTNNPLEPKGTNQDLHDLLIVLDGRDPTDSDLRTIASNTVNAANEYLDQNSSVVKSNYQIISGLLPLTILVKPIIDNNAPVILFGHYFTPDWNNHAVVAYGYNGNMFIVHSGYKSTGGSNKSRVYLSEYLLGSCMVMTYTPSTC